MAYWLPDGGAMSGFLNFSGGLRCGVYALTYRGRVVYVGKATRPFQRIAQHQSRLDRRRKGKDIPAILFDGVILHSCMLAELDRIEKAMIEQYKPRYNQKLNQNSREVRLRVNGFEVILGAGRPRMEERLEPLRRL